MAVDLGQGWDGTGGGETKMAPVSAYLAVLTLLPSEYPRPRLSPGVSHSGCQASAHQCPPSVSCTPFTNYMVFVTQTRFRCGLLGKITPPADLKSSSCRSSPAGPTWAYRESIIVLVCVREYGQLFRQSTRMFVPPPHCHSKAGPGDSG